MVRTAQPPTPHRQHQLRRARGAPRGSTTRSERWCSRDDARSASKPARIVDAHVHLWDPARTDWYPYLSAAQRELNMGDVSGMSRRFDVPTYLAESAGWNVEKLVNVAAATGGHSIDETLELDRRADADGHPDAIIGGLPPTDSVAEAVAALDAQLAAPRFRGVRPMGAAEGPASAGRGAPRPAGARPGVRGDDPPRSAAGDGQGAGGPRRPRRGRRARRLAAQRLRRGARPLDRGHRRPRRPRRQRAVQALRPGDAAGIDGRRRAGSVARVRHRRVRRRPLPVREQLSRRRDARHAWTSCTPRYSAVTAGLDADARDKLFAANAERIYRC